MRSCVSAPLVAGSDLVGVLSIYSAADQSFTEEHQRILEAAASQLATALHRAPASSGQPGTPPSAGHAQRDVLTKPRVPDEVPAATCVAVLRVGATIADLPRLEDLADVVREHLRPHDLVFRRGDELILLLQMPKPEADEALLRIVNHLRVADSSLIVHYTLASAPEDGSSLDELLSKGRASDGPPAARPGSSDRSVH